MANEYKMHYTGDNTPLPFSSYTGTYKNADAIRILSELLPSGLKVTQIGPALAIKIETNKCTVTSGTIGLTSQSAYGVIYNVKIKDQPNHYLKQGEIFLLSYQTTTNILVECNRGTKKDFLYYHLEAIRPSQLMNPITPSNTVIAGNPKDKQMQVTQQPSYEKPSYLVNFNQYKAAIANYTYSTEYSFQGMLAKKSTNDAPLFTYEYDPIVAFGPSSSDKRQGVYNGLVPQFECIAHDLMGDVLSTDGIRSRYEITVTQQQGSRTTVKSYHIGPEDDLYLFAVTPKLDKQNNEYAIGFQQGESEPVKVEEGSKIVNLVYYKINYDQYHKCYCVDLPLNLSFTAATRGIKINSKQGHVDTSQYSYQENQVMHNGEDEVLEEEKQDSKLDFGEEKKGTTVLKGAEDIHRDEDHFSDGGTSTVSYITKNITQVTCNGTYYAPQAGSMFYAQLPDSINTFKGDETYYAACNGFFSGDIISQYSLVASLPMGYIPIDTAIIDNTYEIMSHPQFKAQVGLHLQSIHINSTLYYLCIRHYMTFTRPVDDNETQYYLCLGNYQTYKLRLIINYNLRHFNILLNNDAVSLTSLSSDEISLTPTLTMRYTIDTNHCITVVVIDASDPKDIKEITLTRPQYHVELEDYTLYTD